MTYIYLLTEPETCEPRYVGKTDDPHSRLNEHIAETNSPKHSKDNTHKANWIAKLMRAGLRPSMQIIEEVEDGEDWVQREIWWISHGREMGWRLTNLSDGGDGWGIASEEGRARTIAAHRGSKRRPETVEKLRQAALGHGTSEETRKKLSAAGLGRRHTHESKKKIGERVSAARKGKPQSEAQKAARKAYFARNPDIMRGANSSSAKLTDSQVRQMREAYAQGGTSFREVASDYGVTTMTAHRAITGKSWSNVK